jgi:hypothetical protein
MATATHGYLYRLLGASILRSEVYEEVEADRSATFQALLTVLLSSLAAGVGAQGLGGDTVARITFFALVALLTWTAWAVLTFQIGARLLPQPQTRSDVGELLRTIGFSTAPGCLRILGAIPGLTAPIFVATSIWMLATMVVAVRQALDYDNTLRALAVCGFGWVLAIAMSVALGLAFGPSLS